MSALDFAEHYVSDFGWAVFPLRPESKAPATKDGFRSAPTDRAQLRDWWRREPCYGIGIACDGIVVLDTDVRDGKPGRESLAALELEYGELPLTLQVETPSLGRHDYFAGSMPRMIGVRPGIDLLGYGGYVCAPPTTTAEGAYRWVGEGDSLAALPAWISSLSKVETRTTSHARSVARTTPVRYVGYYGHDSADRVARAREYLSRMPAAVSGSYGHDQTYLAALALVRGYCLPRALAGQLLAEYNRRCDPPWSNEELQHKLDSAEGASRVSDGYLIGGAR